MLYPKPNTKAAADAVPDLIEHTYQLPSAAPLRDKLIQSAELEGLRSISQYRK